MDFAVPADYRVKLKESGRRISTWTLQGNKKKKTVERKGDDYTDYNCCSWYSHARIGKRIGELENKKTSGDHLNYCIIEIAHNPEDGPGDLRRLDITQLPVKDHQLTLIRKNLKV